MKAVILAGGLGTRLRPLTLDTPKPMIPVQGKPLIQHTIERLQKAGITEIVLSLGYLHEKVEEYFGDGSAFGVKISYAIEDEPLGTGGAVRKAAAGFQEPFFLVWGDNLHDIDYQAMQEEYTEGILMALAPREDVEHFGVAELEGATIQRFVEKPAREEAPSNLINAGVFLIDPTLLAALPTGVFSLEKECFERFAGRGLLKAYTHEGQWFPTDTLEKYEEAKQHYSS